MARILAVVGDLMLASRVAESLTAAGHEVRVAGAPDSLERVDAVVCDLDAVAVEDFSKRGVPVLGFYSHLEVATRRRAEAAGIDAIVARSRMARELPALIEGLLSA